MSRRPRRLSRLATPLLLLIAAAPAARADEPKLSFEEPAVHRVYQRDEQNRADIPVALAGEAKDAFTFQVESLGEGLKPGSRLQGVKFVDGKLIGVPTGGPYTLSLLIREKGVQNAYLHTIGPFFVGDLWVLAGQSNMEGYGDLLDVAAPDDRVMALGMDGQWTRAEEPLHWLVDSPDSVHSGDPGDRARRSREAHRARKKGAGLGLPFAVAMVEATGVPVGLVACAHGGTSMEQWSPSKKDEGGGSLYGSMLRQFRLAGGKARGVLWYHGESDAMGDDAKARAAAYPKVFADFIAAVRRDFGQPDLPFLYVQIGRFVVPAEPKSWNAVQEAQRRLPDRVPYTAVVSSIDLELDDLIHVGTQGLKRLGRRLAGVALRDLFSHPAGRSTPTFEWVAPGQTNTLRVKFRGVNRTPGKDRNRMLGLRPGRHIGGFSIRKADGAEIPLIFEARVDPQAVDTVVLKLNGPPPEGAQLWYGHGLDPYCNLTDHEDMAVPVFGPIPLDAVSREDISGQ